MKLIQLWRVSILTRETRVGGRVEGAAAGLEQLYGRYLCAKRAPSAAVVQRSDRRGSKKDGSRERDY